MKKNTKLSIKKYFLSFLIILVIILIFTIVDYVVHLLSEEYSVPSYYFRNKVIFGTLIGILLWPFIKKYKTNTKSILLSVVVSVLLQTRYFLEGYPKEFVFEFLLFHFLILLPVSWIILKLSEKVIKQ